MPKLDKKMTAIPTLDTKLASVEEVSAAIEAGKVLWLAGDEALLKSLPKGKWIGGSIPYFMTDQGGATTKQKIYVSELDVKVAKKIQIQFYNTSNIKNIAKDAPDNGFSILLIPALTQIHQDYAQLAPEYEDMFLKPITGWVTGFHLDDMGSATPMVINGGTGEVSRDNAVAMHVTLIPSKVASIGIINVAKQSEDSDIFEFPVTGFSASECSINGDQKNFADYVIENNIDTRFPLVANYSGAMINISFQEVNTENKTVCFYAPVFSGIQYKLSKPTDNYVSDFLLALPELENVTFCCNCVLNYLHLELKGKKTGTLTGPMTFGEIAYQLLNQTMVYLTIEDE